MMSDYKVNFKEMKSRVGVDDIAYALGYRLDRKAGRNWHASSAGNCPPIPSARR